MILRQFFDAASSTYTYLLASAPSSGAILIDPVGTQVEQYLVAIEQLGLKLDTAIDTHTHADHVTALGPLQDRTGCVTAMGEQSHAACITRHLTDGELITVGDVHLRAVYTPGHTDESMSFVLEPDAPRAVFTGDALLIRSTGRTDFQNGDAGASWDSITKRLFALPDATPVYPAHDYKGWTVSTIAEERRFNPRLAGKSRDQYIKIMAGLGLPNPKMMDVAIPANLACGRASPGMTADTR